MSGAPLPARRRSRHAVAKNVAGFKFKRFSSLGLRRRLVHRVSGEFDGVEQMLFGILMFKMPVRLEVA